MGANRYLEHATAAVDRLTSTWFTADTPGSWVPDDFWKTPTIIEELVKYAVLAGGSPSDHRQTLDTIANALDAGEWWIGQCGYYDDETCWGRMLVTANAWAPTQRYEDDAVKVFDDLDAAWKASEDVCGGGVWWRRADGGDNFKAANATLGYMQIALGLANTAAAERGWKWIADHGLIDAKGMVWGGLDGSCKPDPKNPPVVAQQGNAIAPIWQLYGVTGDASLLDTAQRIVDATLATMVWPDTQIVTTPVDAQWRSDSEQYRLDNGNQALFKGIFVSFLGDFAAHLATVDDPKRLEAARGYGAALRANADSLHAAYPQGIYDMDWLHGDPSYSGDDDSQTQACLQYSALCAFDAAAKAP
jgi:predicted alpha-1,6-mannanase (GH76 family)